MDHLERLRKTDQEFAAVLAEEERMRAFLRRQQESKNFSAVNQKLADEYFESPPVGTSARRRFLLPLVAAAAVVVAALLTWFWAFPASPQSLYQAYAVHDPISLTSRSGGPQLSNTVRNFNDGNYADAVLMLKQLAAETPGDPEVNRALGIAYLETGKLDRALAIFQTLAEGDTSARDDGIWYTALTYLRMEDTVKAKEWLEKVERGTRWYPFARKLSRKLS